MTELRFEFEWIDPGGVQVPELSATWASLRIIADGSVITRVLDERVKTVRDFVYVPLYPFAEWFASNWWFLTNEYRNREKQHDSEFQRRHELRTGRQGYASPDLRFFCSGSETHLVWQPFKPQWTRVEFLTQGSTWVKTSEFREVCFDFIDVVVQRLAASSIENTYLQEDWDAIQTSEFNQDELKFCETTAAMGLDPYDLDQSKSDEIIDWTNQLGELVDEAVQIANPSKLHEQYSAITAAIKESRYNVLRLDALKSYTHDLSSGHLGSAPWRVGYDWARDLRNHIGLDGEPLSSMAELADVLGEHESTLDQATRPVNSLSETPMVDGLITCNEDKTTSFALRQFNEPGRRFSFCRALSEVLAYPWSDALITDSYSERQKRNRAFAAEFLAPSDSLKNKVKQQIINDEEIDDLAEEFGVSPLVVKHQIENHQIAQLAEPVFA